MDEEKSPRFIEFLSDELYEISFPSTLDVLLRYISMYVADMEEYLKRQKVTIYHQFRDLEDSLHEKEEYLYVVENLYPSLLRSSLFLALYSLFEFGLKDRCYCLKETNNLSISIEKIPESGYINKYRKFLEENGVLNLGSSTDWQELIKFRELRNRIAHDQGIINDKNNRLMNYITGHPDWLGLENQRLIVKQGFCEHVIEIIKSIFQAIDHQLPEDCKNLESHFGFSP